MWTNFIPVCVILLHKDSDFKNCSWLISKKVYAGSYSLLYAKFQFNLLPKIFQLYHGRNKLHFNKMMISTLNLTNVVRDRPFNLKGGGVMVFCFVQKFFLDNTRVRIFIFFSHKAWIFFSKFNIRLYDKNSESDYFFFPPPKSEYFFQQHWESEYFFRKKP